MNLSVNLHMYLHLKKMVPQKVQLNLQLKTKVHMKVHMNLHLKRKVQVKCQIRVHEGCGPSSASTDEVRKCHEDSIYLMIKKNYYFFLNIFFNGTHDHDHELGPITGLGQDLMTV